MALEYIEPIMTCDGEDESVEHVWAKYNNTSGAIREHYFRELTLHNLFYPCPRLTRELQIVAIKEGYKRHQNITNESSDWGSQQPPNLMLVSEVDYLETDFTSSKMIKKSGVIDRRLLYGWIKDCFRPADRQKYEWYALWLILNDKHLVKNKDLTLFAKQMVMWFKKQFQKDDEEEAKSLSKAIRIYSRILGANPDVWNESEILTTIHDAKRGVGASESGYKQIKKLFFNLRSQLSQHKIVMKDIKL